MQITKLSKRRFVKDDLIGERAEYLTHYRAGIQINLIFNIDIDIDIARAIYCSSNILLSNILLNIDIAQAIYCPKLKH